MSIYIHIPFCHTICTYCDFCKIFYNEKVVDNYLQALNQEIKSKYQNEIIDTIYIGGGTPSSLNLKQLTKLFSIIKSIKLNNNYEFTFECNIESINKTMLEFLYLNGVNRLSIGIQSFDDKILTLLNRNHSQEQVIKKISLAKQIGFKNINVDLIYGLYNQSLEDLKNDLNLFLKLDINHISTYSLMIEPHTKLYIDKTKLLDEETDYQMYKYINETLKQNGFNHYEISNFAKDGFVSKHNLTYWNNQNYYGFGLGASGYLDDIRYENTRNLNKYLKGEYIKEEHKLTLLETMQNEMILGLRKIEGVNKEKFKKRFGKDIKNVFDIEKLIQEQKLIDNNGFIYINKNHLYLSNEILINFID